METFSRLVNVLTGGDWELFCTRAHRSKWKRIVWLIDAIAGAMHCRGCYAWDRRYNGRPK